MCVTLNLKVAGWNLRRTRILLIRGLFVPFPVALYKAAFRRVLASVCEARVYDSNFLT